MLAALTAWEWALTGGGAEECVALAREALADDTIVAADNGFLTVPAIGILFMADRDEALGHRERLLADSHRAGSLFAISCVHLWSGITQLRRGELAEAGGAGRDRPRRAAAVGRAAGRRRLLQLADRRWRGSSGATSTARGASWGRARIAATTLYDAGHLWLRTDVELLLAEGRYAEALERSREYATAVGRYVNPAWVPWRSLQALALDRLGSAGGGAGARDRGDLPTRARGARRGRSGDRCGSSGSSSAATGWRRWRRRSTLLEGSPARLELAKALLALGSLHRRSRRPAEAREPLRRALELAERCGALALAGEARTELHAAGSRPAAPRAAAPRR